MGGDHFGFVCPPARTMHTHWGVTCDAHPLACNVRCTPTGVQRCVHTSRRDPEKHTLVYCTVCVTGRSTNRRRAAANVIAITRGASRSRSITRGWGSVRFCLAAKETARAMRHTPVWALGTCGQPGPTNSRKLPRISTRALCKDEIKKPRIKKQKNQKSRNQEIKKNQERLQKGYPRTRVLI